jgi:hypothetical protein
MAVGAAPKTANLCAEARAEAPAFPEGTVTETKSSQYSSYPTAFFGSLRIKSGYNIRSLATVWYFFSNDVL